ncbi:MAG: deoxyguanosinetriphosphate triphosphohydrolase [Anaerolineaceae bacterium]|nr:deoxyguanosinetriphosphate triphosphohydrolase [Anaerolineaceae bacterium]
MLMTREELELNENRSVAPYGFKSSKSKGRQYEEEKAVYRTEYQRDRDRIIHTTAFRRLEYKTQVFENNEGDYYRTRLTHSLEVAQVGRTIARALAANEDLVEAICLAHDLGHPPFGHTGERVLNSLLSKHGGFDHNKQSIRILTDIECRYPHFRGLNLTWEVREGIVKHETEYDISDAYDYNPDLRGHLEAQIANAADELAYNAHDLDDGIRSGILTPTTMKPLTLWQIAKDSINWDGKQLTELTRHRMIRRIIGLEIHDLIENTNKNLQNTNPTDPLHIQQLEYNIVESSKQYSQYNKEINTFLRNNLFTHPRVRNMENKAIQLLGDLYSHFVSNPDCLPSSIQQRIDFLGIERAVCDYIAGMTDRFATAENLKLNITTKKTT